METKSIFSLHVKLNFAQVNRQLNAQVSYYMCNKSCECSPLTDPRLCMPLFVCHFNSPGTPSVPQLMTETHHKDM